MKESCPFCGSFDLEYVFDVEEEIPTTAIYSVSGNSEKNWHITGWMKCNICKAQSPHKGKSLDGERANMDIKQRVMKAWHKEPEDDS